MGIDRALLRNNDYWRRSLQGPCSAEELPPSEERTLGQLHLEVPPRALSAFGVFPDDSSFAPSIFRCYVAQNSKLPTCSQLQSCAKNNGSVLPYKVAAPLISECRS